MNPLFSVRITAGFERTLTKLVSKHSDLTRTYAEAVQILETDPYNRTRAHNIKKLKIPTSNRHRVLSPRNASESNTWNRQKGLA